MKGSAVALTCTLALALGPRVSAADDDALARGQAKAKAGDYRGAITDFRTAERVAAAPLSACLLGLAYFRLQDLGSAAVMFGLCGVRAQAAAWPVPKWVDTEGTALREALAASALGRVELAIDPRVTALVIPALVDGEPMPVQGTLYLPAGGHRILGRTARGDLPIDVTVLAKQGTRAAFPAAPRPPSSIERPVDERPMPVPAPVPKACPRATARTVLLIGGGAALVAGGLVHALAVRPAYDDLSNAPDDIAYAMREGSYTTRRNVTVGLYAAGAAALITGVVLGLTATDDTGPRLDAAVSPTGAVMSVRWTR